MDAPTPGEAFIFGDLEIRVRARLRRIFRKGGIDHAEVQLGVGNSAGGTPFSGAFPVVEVPLNEVILPGRGEGKLIPP